jgi:archaellum biogenesis protein FlaJ (TadC family)
MSLGIVLPVIVGTEDMNMFIYLSSFLLIFSEGLLMYLLKSMIPPDEIWHLTGEQGKIEKNLDKTFKISLLITILLGSTLFFAKYSLELTIISDFSLEILFALSITPLIISGVKSFLEENNIARKERNFLGFMPALGSISTMRGGKINDSVYYLSKKNYGVLTKHIRDLYKRLRTRIDDTASWEWFGVDTGSNYIQRSSEMFREATFAAANPRKVSIMIAENIRKIRNLRVKKLTIVNTSIALFAGITFGISFAIYISLVIGEHLNEIMLQTGQPFSGVDRINVGTLLYTIDPALYQNNFIIIFFVLVAHCFMLALTVTVLRGSHKYLTLMYFIPFVWIVSVTSFAVKQFLGGMLAA